jgi:meso-butanediol dehydrogenase/(S,S)-butanediol dehydrogenase/diacetyl reductase
MKRFENKTVLVTGAGSGIGAATVRRLFVEGASIVAGDIKKANVDKVVAEFEGSDRIYGVAVDIVDRAQVEAFVSGAVERFGTLYSLINSAGITGVGSLLDFEPDAWRRVLSVNLDGPFNVSQVFARAMTAAGWKGSIVNISSAAGIRGVPKRLAYAASKHGIVGLSATMAIELAPLGIRVNTISPGMIRTPLTAYMFGDPANVERISAAHPIGRYGEAEEIAAAIAFLASEDASFVVGANLVVDGGKTCGISSF